MASEIRLASLDDPSFFADASWNDSIWNLAPLQDPTPKKHADRPHPLEPSKVASDTQFGSKTFSSTGKYRTEIKGNGRQRAGNAGAPLADVLNEDNGDELAPFSYGSQEKKGHKRQRLDNAEATTSIKLPNIAQAISTANMEMLSEPMVDAVEFVHLPQLPVRRGQKVPRMPMIPPLLQGLHEPPPDAGLFPPITPNGFERYQGQNGGSVQMVALSATQSTAPSIDPSNECPRKPSVTTVKRTTAIAKRQKWTDEETKDLLQGVERFGIGKWKKIMAQPEYKFNNRSPVDLKDRFRTVRPEDYGHAETRKRKNTVQASEIVETGEVLTKSVSNTVVSNLLTDENEDLPAVTSKSFKVHKITLSKDSIRNRSHHHDEDDLARLGIREPFVPSTRRDRRPFSEAEDDALLRGVELHRGAWKAIRADPTLKFEEKRTTCDLKDRFRNRWPAKYAELGLKLGKKPNVKDPAMSCIIQSRSESTVAVQVELDTPSTTPRKPHNSSSLTFRHNESLHEPFPYPHTGLDSNAQSFFDYTEGYTERGSALPMTPVFLDRSIVDWAQSLNSAAPQTKGPTGNGSGGNGGASNGARGPPGLPSFSFDHAQKSVDPSATCRPAGAKGPA